MTKSLFLYASVAAGLGACTRFGVTEILGKNRLIKNMGWPVATFVINIFGSFLLALFVAHIDDTFLQKILTVGFLGGFTTFSTFNNEVFNLWENRHGGLSILYALSSFLISLAATWVGFHV